MVNYIFNNGSHVNIDKNINIDANGMKGEELNKLVDQIVNGDHKPDNKTVDVRTDVETAEVTETRSVKVTRPVASSSSPIAQYLSDASHAEYTLQWLHSVMDGIENAKDKLLPLKGLVENGVFKRVIPHKVFIEIFGEMPKSSYSKWMKKDANYTEEELENSVKSYKYLQNM